MKLVCVILCCLLFTACASSSLRPTDPSRSAARSAQPVQSGVILDVKQVTIKANTEAAQTVGMGLGGYVGNAATRDNSEVVRVLSTAVGAVLGSVVGSTVGEAVLDQQGTELIVQLQNQTISVVQQVDENSLFNVGDTVWVIRTHGEIRVLPKSQ